MQNQLKLGYMPTRRKFFSREDAIRYRTLILDKIRAVAPHIDIVDIEQSYSAADFRADAARLIDEIAGWLVARKLQTSGMTTHLDVKFKKSIPTGSDITLEIRAHLTEIKHNFAFIAAQISCNGQVCTQGELTYFCFSKEKAQSEFHFTHCPTIDEIE